VFNELRGQSAVQATDTLVTRHLPQRLPETMVATALFAHPRSGHFCNDNEHRRKKTQQRNLKALKKVMRTFTICQV